METKPSGEEWDQLHSDWDTKGIGPNGTNQRAPGHTRERCERLFFCDGPHFSFCFLQLITILTTYLFLFEEKGRRRDRERRRRKCGNQTHHHHNHNWEILLPFSRVLLCATFPLLLLGLLSFLIGSSSNLFFSFHIMSFRCSLILVCGRAGHKREHRRLSL